MIRYLAVIRPNHNGKVIAVDSHEIPSISALEVEEGSKVLGAYDNPDIARKFMLLGLQTHRPRPSPRRRRA